MSQRYAYRYGERLVYIKKTKAIVCNHDAYVYLCIDEDILNYLRNQKCKVYKDFAIPQEPRKEVNAIYEIFKMQVPYKIPLTTIQV